MLQSALDMELSTCQSQTCLPSISTKLDKSHAHRPAAGLPSLTIRLLLNAIQPKGVSSSSYEHALLEDHGTYLKYWSVLALLLTFSSFWFWRMTIWMSSNLAFPSYSLLSKGLKGSFIPLSCLCRGNTLQHWLLLPYVWLPDSINSHFKMFWEEKYKDLQTPVLWDTRVDHDGVLAPYPAPWRHNKRTNILLGRMFGNKEA